MIHIPCIVHLVVLFQVVKSFMISVVKRIWPLENLFTKIYMMRILNQRLEYFDQKNFNLRKD